MYKRVDAISCRFFLDEVFDLEYENFVEILQYGSPKAGLFLLIQSLLFFNADVYKIKHKTQNIFT